MTLKLIMIFTRILAIDEIALSTKTIACRKVLDINIIKISDKTN